MKKRIQEYFIYLVAVILFVAAGFILLAATSEAVALNHPDPFLFLPRRLVFCLIAGLDLALSAFLLLAQDRQRLKLTLVTWLAAYCLIYRAGLAWCHEPNLFVCLGNLNDRLCIPPRLCDGITSVAAGALLVGSCIFLMLDWYVGWREVRRRRPAANAQPVAAGQT